LRITSRLWCNDFTEAHAKPLTAINSRAVMKTKLSNGQWFTTYQDQPTDEVYGWLEADGQIVKGSGGWYRTHDPHVATSLAELNAGAAKKPTQDGK
jgi:hypothetical protein